MNVRKITLFFVCFLWMGGVFAQSSNTDVKAPTNTVPITLSKTIKVDKTAVPQHDSKPLQAKPAVAGGTRSADFVYQLPPDDPGGPGDPGGPVHPPDPGDPGNPGNPPSNPTASVDAGRTASTLDVTAMGGAAFNVPFTLPPGIGNVVPHIGLAYNSQSGNGTAGYGWNVSGLSTIVRLPPTKYHDDMIAGVNYDQRDRFAIDGQRLLLKSGTYGSDGSEYQTENFSNARVLAHGVSSYGASYGPEYFEVLYPDGSKSYYGQSYNSRTPSDYALTYTENPLGVRISFSYLQVNNVLYISQITYGGIGAANAINQIYFNYSSVSRAEQVFVGGQSFYRDQVLNKISVVANGVNFRHYKLTYDAVPILNYQRLTMIQEFSGSEAKAYDPIYLSYGYTGDVISSHTISNLSLSGIAANNSQVVTADFTGNGSMDFLLYPNSKDKFWAFYDLEPGSPYMQLGYEINTGPFRELFPATELTYNNKILSGQGMGMVKDNGYNGLKFSVYSSGTVAPVYFQYEREWNNIPLGQGYYSDCDHQFHDGSPVNFDFISGDFNGDGLTDVICVGQSNTVITYEYMDNSGNPWLPQVNSTNSPDYMLPPSGPGNCVQEYGQSGSPIYYVNLDRRQTSNFVINLGQIYPYYTPGDKLYAADANGDGKTDIILVKNGSMTVYTLNQNNYLEYLWQTNDSRITNGQPAVLGDFNGDGKIDIMFSTGNNSLYATFMSTGKGFVKQEQYQPFANVAGTWDGTPGVERLQLHYIIANDVDGDGKTDIISAQTTTYNNSAYGNIDITIHHNIGNSSSSGPMFSSGTPSSSYTNLRHYPIPIFLNPSRPNNNLEFGFMSDNSISLFKFQKDFRKEAQLTSISQDGVYHTLEYGNLISGSGSGDIPLYQSDYEQTYPFINLYSVPGLNVVSKITRYFGSDQLYQIFGYGNAVSHAEGLGFMGFGEVVRSNWHTGSGDANRMFTTNIQDPQLHGANVRNFTSRYGYINPSIKNMALTDAQPTSAVADGASIYDYINRNDQFYHTDILPNRVFVNIPLSATSKDMLTNTFNTEAYEYDAYQNPTKQTSNANGTGTKIVETTYDNNPNGYYIGRVLSRKTTLNNGSDVYSSEEQYSYAGFLTSQVRSKGYNTAFSIDDFSYDGFGNTTAKTTTVPGGAQRTMAMQYDATGRFLTNQTDPDGLQTSYSSDSSTGYLLSKTDPSGQVETYNYDDWGRQTILTDGLGQHTYRSYQKVGSNTELSETDDEGRFKLTIMNALGQNTEVRQKNVLNQLTGKAWQYDAYGRQNAESEVAQPGSYNQWNTTEYDEFGRVKRTVAFTGKTTSISYSGLSTTVNDGTKSTTTTKNGLGEAASVQDPGGYIGYTYFANGKLKTIAYGGITINIEQDGWGRRTKLTDPSAGVYSYEYDGFNQLTKETSPKGITQYTYDRAGKLTNKSIVGDGTNLQYAYSYDATTKLVTGLSLSNADGNNTNYTYSYDGQRRLLSRREDNLHAIFVKNNTYDSYGRVASENYVATNKADNRTAQKTVEFQYQNGELLQKNIQGTGEIIWKVNSFDNNGRLSSALQGSNLRTTYQYDAYGMLQQCNVEKTSSGVQTLMSLNYNFDAQQGLLNSRNNTALGWSETFGYDNLKRLTSFNDNNGNNSQSYDAGGRINNNSQLGDYAYDPNSYKQTELNNLNSAANTYYQSRNLQQVTYNAFKSPVDITEPGVDHLSFQYNGSLGRSHMYYGGEQADKMMRRYRRHYAEDGSTEITEDTQTGSTSFVFYLGGDAYSAPAIWKEVQGGGITTADLYYLHRDHLGSIVMISNAQGDAVEKRQFDAWGNIVKITDGVGNPLSVFMITDRGFTGHEHLLSVGLINMNGRLYDPKLHRFLSPDNFVQDFYNTQNLNRFAYAMNNPLMYTDENGEFLNLIIGAIIGGIVNRVAHGAQFSWKGLAYFGAGAAAGALGAGIGAGISSALGGGSFGAGFIGSTAAKAVGSGFLSGAVIGAGGGLAGGFASGFGNALVDGESFGSALSAGLKSGAMGALSGGVLGGAVSGIDAAIHGRNFWTGNGVSTEDVALSSNAGSGGQQYADNAEMRTDYDATIGAKDGMTLDQVEKKISANITLATDDNLPPGYSINEYGLLEAPGKMAGGVTATRYEGWFSQHVVSKTYMSPGIKGYDLTIRNMIFKHEFMHVWHANLDYNMYNVSEHATSTFSYAYAKAYGLTTFYYFKNAIGYYPAKYSWRQFGKIIPLWIK